jgi:hypothetical protein
VEVRSVFRTVRLLISGMPQGEGKAASEPLKGIAPAAGAHPRCEYRLILHFESADFTFFSHLAEFRGRSSLERLGRQVV